jgi:hypothetical protein
VLRGAGVALALPWLESLAPRPARAQAAPPPRFVAIYFPLGVWSYVADPPPDRNFWTPTGTGAGAAWQLSPLLAPLAPVKSRVTVLSHVNQTCYGPIGIEPSNGPLTGSFLTATKCNPSPADVGRNGVSIDQRIAQARAVPSIQAGLSTLDSYCDGYPCSMSRSISWSAPDTPLYKIVDPQALFDRIVLGGQPKDPAVAARAAARKSVLDFVVGHTTSLEPRLGQSDRARLDQFLTSVRDLEQRVASVASCLPIARPTLSASVGNVPADYNRDAHANVMIDLIIMALSCDAARVVSFMLDDARSYFPYTFLPLMHFSPDGSTPASPATAGGPVNCANAGSGNDCWLTIAFWYVSKLSLLCQKLAAIPDAGGASLLDGSVVWFGSGQQGEAGFRNLPLLYVGGGGGRLQVDRAIDLRSQQLSNVYLTFLNRVFGVPDASFGDSTGIIPEILV